MRLDLKLNSFWKRFIEIGSEFVLIYTEKTLKTQRDEEEKLSIQNDGETGFFPLP